MTDWTADEERVARALEPDAWFNRENAFADFPDVADEVVRPSIEQARRAIAAMQPRWRDVKTDPPQTYTIAHDGFAGTIQGHYVTREGKRGVVLQQVGTRVVHVYGEKWLTQPPPAPEPKP